MVTGDDLVARSFQGGVEVDRLDLVRGTMMSCTVIALRSNRLSRIHTCFCGRSPDLEHERAELLGRTFALSSPPGMRASRSSR